MFSPKRNQRVNAVIGCLALIAFFHVSAFAQTFTPATPSNAKQFVGVWKASFHGSPFLTVNIALDGDKLVGSVSHANIELNKTGELTKAEANEIDAPDPITDARVNGDTLRITTKSTDGSEDSIDAEMKLLAMNEADFRMLVPPDVPAPKPWRLQRVAAKR